MTEEAPTLGDGRYRLVEVLGHGGMAVVYRAFDTHLKAERAVKLLSPSLKANPDMRERFFREARTMAGLTHPNLLTVHDVQDDDGRIFIVMALAEGGNFWDWVRDHGPMPPAMAVRAMLSVLDAIDFAHEKGIVHRDIKPHNVLLTTRGQALLTDFGIAQVQDAAQRSLTRTGASIGTLGFMAPEQRKRTKKVDARADVFALGCTLYAVLAAELPMDIYATEAQTELYEQVHPALVPIVQKASRYLPGDRYQSAAEMAAALEACLSELPDDPADTPPLGTRSEVPKKAKLKDFFLPTHEAATLPTPAFHSSGGDTPELSGFSASRSDAGVPSGVDAPPQAQPARRWLMPLASVLLGAGVGGVLWWSGTRDPDQPEGGEPAPAALMAKGGAAPPTDAPTATAPTPQEPTSPPAPVDVEVVEPEPEPPEQGAEPRSPTPQAAPSPEIQAPPSSASAAVEHPMVTVVVNSSPWSNWSMSGGTVDSGRTPYRSRLPAPGDYTFELETEEGDRHTLRLELDGSQRKVVRCYDFVDQGPC